MDVLPKVLSPRLSRLYDACVSASEKYPHSSRLIRKEFSEHLYRFYKKPVLWSIGYAVNSCGGASLEKIKDYIKNQKSPLTSTVLSPYDQAPR